MSATTLFNLSDFAHEAQAILDAAKKQAEEMLAATRSEIENEKEQKAKEGYDAGFQKGLDEGLEEGRKEGEEKKINEIQKEASFLVKNLDSISKAFVDVKIDLLEKAEADLIELSIAIAEKIIKVKIDAIPEIVLENIKTAIKFTANKTAIQINVHQDDLKVIEKYLPDLKKEFDDIGSIDVVENEKVDRGGCIISTGSGVADQNISTQIEKIYQNLLSVKKD